MKGKKQLILAAVWFGAFLLLTAAVIFVDVAPVGQGGTEVGLSALNRAVHSFLGVSMKLYHLTDWLSIVPLGAVLIFGVLGLFQLIKRKGLVRVDRDILLTGALYLAVAAAFLIFEFVGINCRPILIEGAAEVSYPSSTTLLVTTVIPSAAMLVIKRVKSRAFAKCISILSGAFAVFMVAARMLSGVHWFTDIIGGLLLGGGLLQLYRFGTERMQYK